MKKINKKSFLALGLMLGLGALSVAYAALSTTLTIQSGTESERGVSVNSLVTFVKDGSANIPYSGEIKPIKINYCASCNYKSTEPGEVTISNNGLEANISGTTFSSPDTAIYTLCLENKHNSTVYLAEDPTVVITNANDDDVSNIEVKLRYVNGDKPDVLKGTSLAAGEKKILFVIIDVKEMPEGSASLNFTFKPQWTTENPTTGSTGNQGGVSYD